MAPSEKELQVSSELQDCIDSNIHVYLLFW